MMIAITAFFAPPDQGRRKKNFLAFKKAVGIPLIVVEWSREGVFHIQPDECDDLIRVTSGDLLWQKEALLNIGIKKARDRGHEKVALLDADIVFHDPDWHEKVSKALDSYDLVHCFERAHYLPEIERIETLERHDILNTTATHSLKSLSSAIFRNGGRLFDHRGQTTKHESLPGTDILGNPGMAYAINISQNTISLYTNSIVGAGDLVLLAAAHDLLDALFEGRKFSTGHIADIKTWATQYKVSQVNAGYCEMEVAHLWHGEPSARGYMSRYKLLSDLDYTPNRDVQTNSEGLIEFTPEGQRLSGAVGGYITSRNSG